MYKHIVFVTSLVLLLFMPVSYAASEAAAPTKETTETQIEERKTTLEISDAWARKSMLPNNNSAAYMKINNPTDQQITIIGASASTIANNVELHKSFVDEKGISRMTSVDKIVVPAQSTIELEPGGLHIMLFDLKRSLSVGDKFTFMIKIQDMEPVKVETSVK